MQIVSWATRRRIDGLLGQKNLKQPLIAPVLHIVFDLDIDLFMVVYRCLLS